MNKNTELKLIEIFCNCDDFIQEYGKEIAKIAKEINPAEVQINTPLRPCGTKPLSEAEIDVIESYFSSLNTITVYKAEKKKIKPISSDDTLRRRGKI